MSGVIRVITIAKVSVHHHIIAGIPRGFGRFLPKKGFLRYRAVGIFLYSGYMYPECTYFLGNCCPDSVLCLSWVRRGTSGVLRLRGTKVTESSSRIGSQTVTVGKLPSLTIHSELENH